MKAVILFLIRFYQRFLSFDHGLLRVFMSGGRACRFTPTCSDYTYEAISRYGIMVGLRLGFARIIRCHPGNPGGWDPVP